MSKPHYFIMHDSTGNGFRLKRPLKDHNRIDNWKHRITAFLQLQRPTQSDLWFFKNLATKLLLDDWATDDEKDLARNTLDILSS